MRRILPFLLPVFALVAGCSGKASSPASPSASVGGALITGSIVSGQSAGLASLHTSASSTATGIVVSIQGTDLQTTADGSGHFSLSGVPAGDVGLQFSGTGINAQVSLPAVQSTETIDLSVSLDGGSATIESEHRSGGSQEQLEGRVESFPPADPLTFVVNGQTVVTDDNTSFFLGDSTASFDDLAIGQRVHVAGSVTSAGLLATTVQIQNTNTSIPVELNGIVENFELTATGFQFDVGSQLIKGDGTTTFDSGSLADLTDGVRVEVKGLQQDGYVQATTIHVNTTDNQTDSASIEGILKTISGTGSDLTLMVGTTTVTTTSSTEVQRRGDVQDLSVLQEGMTLHVVGTRQSDGSLIARKIQIKDDGVDGKFQITGSMGGVHGSCSPSTTLSFVVNGYSIVTDDSTTFTPDCGTFKSGTTVKVIGTRQASGKVLAESVEKQ